MPEDQSWAGWPVSPRPGLTLWPVWGPLPDWLPPGSGLLGLATGLAGAAAGAGVLRVGTWLAARGLGRPAHRAAEADLLLVAGSFLGWQPVVVALLLGALLTMLADPLSRRLLGRSVPFGVWLAIGIVLSWLGWRWLGPLLRPVLFHGPLLAGLALGGALLVLTTSILVRRLLSPSSASS
jgi:leader peptidase (prepilin peptidase)/N-methyltransferase